MPKTRVMFQFNELDLNMLNRLAHGDDPIPKGKKGLRNKVLTELIYPAYIAKFGAESAQELQKEYRIKKGYQEEPTI